MTRFAWGTLLALAAWLSAGRESRPRVLERERSAAAAVAALDAPARPAAPRAHDVLSALLRQLALRGGEPSRRFGARTRHAGSPPPLAALLAMALAPRPAAPWRASAAAVRRTSGHAATRLAFPYDATAPPPAGRRA